MAPATADRSAASRFSSWRASWTSRGRDGERPMSLRMNFAPTALSLQVLQGSLADQVSQKLWSSTSRLPFFIDAQGDRTGRPGRRSDLANDCQQGRFQVIRLRV